MSNPSSNWRLPADWLAFLSLWVLPAVCVTVGILLPAAGRRWPGAVITLYGAGAAAGLLGIVLLVLARLPLYRQRRFWTVGPGLLDARHRRLYHWAYGCVGFCLLLFAVVWMAAR